MNNFLTSIVLDFIKKHLRKSGFSKMRPLCKKEASLPIDGEKEATLSIHTYIYIYIYKLAVISNWRLMLARGELAVEICKSQSPRKHNFLARLGDEDRYATIRCGLHSLAVSFSLTRGGAGKGVKNIACRFQRLTCVLDGRVCVCSLRRSRGGLRPLLHRPDATRRNCHGVTVGKSRNLKFIRKNKLITLYLLLVCQGHPSAF